MSVTYIWIDEEGAKDAHSERSQNPFSALLAKKAPTAPTKAELEQAGCVLAKHAWDRDTVECGPGAPSPAQAAQVLANERWTLPEDLQKQKARLLR